MPEIMCFPKHKQPYRRHEWHLYMNFPYIAQGCEEAGPRVLTHPSEDLQAVPTEFKAVLGHSQTEPSSGWRGETVVWTGAHEAPFALTYNKVLPHAVPRS